MKKVLLIEDDATLRENIAELLELENFKVSTATNGLEGLDKAKRELPNVIVCDIMMPKLDGYGVLEGLSKSDKTKYIPFIFLSAKTERKDVRKGMNLGADDYITKPFEEEELITAIESRLAKASILKEQRTVQTNIIQQNKEGIKSLEELKEFIINNRKIKKYKSGEVVYDEGNHANNIYLIKDGVVKSHKIDEFGKELITTIFKTDEFFGYTSFTDNVPYLESATTMEKTEVVAISKDELKKILKKNHKLTLEFIQLLADNLVEFKEQLLQMAYGSVKKKTASTILQFTEKIPTKSVGTIKISRSDLASVAGIATESLIRTLSSLKKDGLINIEGRNITVLDIEKLKRVN